MSDINYSFSAGDGQTPPPAPAELVAFTDCELIRIDSQMCLVINRLNGNQQIIAPQVVDALTYCATFKTIDAHAADLAATRPELKGNAAMAKSALTTLDAAGMLMRASDLLKRYRAASRAAVAPSRIFVITCDRPAAVERLLESMLAVPTLSSHEGFYLIDDSREPGNQARNAELVDAFSTRAAKGMHYVGATAQAALLERLLGELPEAEAGIRSLLDREQWAGYKTYGRSRTLALLLSVGYRSVVLDDDILCQALKPVIEEPGLTFGGRSRQSAFFPDNQILFELMQPTGSDPLSGHCSFLGQPLGYAASQLKDGDLTLADLEDVNAMLVNVLDPDCRILMTQCGSWGDPGIGSSHWALNIDPDSLDRLLAAKAGINETLKARRMWLGSTRPSFSRTTYMSQMTGIDNSVLMPPYFPAFRGEDAVFGAMVGAMHQDSASLDYPWAVPHLPLEHREANLRDPIANADLSLSMYARKLVESVDYKDRSSPEDRLTAIAHDLRTLTERSDADLVIDYRTQAAEGLSDFLRNLRGQAARSADVGSETWKQYVQRAIDETVRALAQPRSLAQMEGLPEGTTDAEVVAEFRARARDFAAALDAWPAMREVAREFELPRGG